MKRVLVTGVAGEVGSSLVHHLSQSGSYEVVGFDIRKPSAEVESRCVKVEVGDIADAGAVLKVGEVGDFDSIYHLAGVLSTGGEKAPLLAHHVNVAGTLNILELSRVQSERRGQPVTVVFTSTIAAYGVGSIEEKAKLGRVTEDQALNPVTMYGANKLYCEALGRYYSENFGMLEDCVDRIRPDFRAVRFPGLLSAHTLPTGGTSDYAPEMVHAAAQGVAYRCFVRPDTRIPFMMMPDGVRALLMVGDADRSRLTRRVYNVGAFAPSAGEIAGLVSQFFPNSAVTYEPHPARQAIVDSWPEDVDDSAARRDFGWSPLYSCEGGFSEYLMPSIVERYGDTARRRRDMGAVTN